MYIYIYIYIYKPIKKKSMIHYKHQTLRTDIYKNCVVCFYNYIFFLTPIFTTQ